MRTERQRRGQEGFTLIEVLAAMVILAVGLLALEALGIGAAKAVSQAGRRSEMVAVAAGALEQAQQEVRRPSGGWTSGETCQSDDQSGLQICTTIQSRATLTSLPPQTARVQVRVNRPGSATDTLTVTSNVFDPKLP